MVKQFYQFARLRAAASGERTLILRPRRAQDGGFRSMSPSSRVHEAPAPRSLPKLFLVPRVPCVMGGLGREVSGADLNSNGVSGCSRYPRRRDATRGGRRRPHGRSGRAGGSGGPRPRRRPRSPEGAEKAGFHGNDGGTLRSAFEARCAGRIFAHAAADFDHDGFSDLVQHPKNKSPGVCHRAGPFRHRPRPRSSNRDPRSRGRKLASSRRLLRHARALTACERCQGSRRKTKNV